MKSVLVYGPEGCGKTRNAKRIAAALGLRTVVDDFHMQTTEGWPRENALLLTNEHPGTAFPFRVLAYADAMRLVQAAS